MRVEVATAARGTYCREKKEEGRERESEEQREKSRERRACSYGPQRNRSIMRSDR